MASPARDWIGAASCCEGPPPPATFADLPPTQKRDLLRLTCAALLSIAFFITIALLPRPLPSRRLVPYVLLPNADVASQAVVHTRVSESTDAPSRTAVRERSPLQSAVRVVSVHEPARRRNPFSRFFRGMGRTIGVLP